MATVITSLATVLPVVGKTVVSWLWGGLLKASLQKILLDAGTGFLKQVLLLMFQYVCNYFMSNIYIVLLQNKVKMLHLTSKSAGLLKDSSAYILRYPYVLRNAHVLRNVVGCTGCLVPAPLAGTGERALSTFNNSQRPYAGDLKWLVGFVEGDGSFSVNKNGKYIKYEFAIETHINDIQLLYKIKSILNGLGSITTRKRTNTELARLKISSKNDLKRIIIPIFDKYGMLTSKQYDYLYFRDCLLRNIIYYEHLPFYERPNYTPFNYTMDILNLYYFDAWLVGFIEAESSFSTFTALKETNKTCKFSISQTNGIQIITAIKERLSLNSNPYTNIKTNSGALHSVIETTSVRGVQNVINFMKDTPVKLKGNKRAQYLKWLHELRVNPRYRNLNIPNHY